MTLATISARIPQQALCKGRVSAAVLTSLGTKPTLLAWHSVYEKNMPVLVAKGLVQLALQYFEDPFATRMFGEFCWRRVNRVRTPRVGLLNNNRLSN